MGMAAVAVLQLSIYHVRIRFKELWSGDDFLNDITVDIGQAIVSSLETKSEAFMIKAKLMHDGGLEIMYMDFVFSHVEPEFIRFTVGNAAFDAAPSQDHGITVGVMVPAQNFTLGGSSFAEGCTTKLTTQNDQSFLKQSPLFEISDECGDGTVHRAALLGEAIADVFGRIGAVEIPAPIEQLYIANPLFNQAAGEEAVVTEGGFTQFDSVSLEDPGWLLADVHHFGHGHLHAVGQFVLGYTRAGFRVSQFFCLKFVELFQGVEAVASQFSIHSRRIRCIQNGISLGTALDALEHRGEESTAKGILAPIGLNATGDQDHETGEILVHRSQSVRDPSPEGRATGPGRSCVDKEFGGRMIELVGVHGFDHAKLISDLVEMRDSVRQPDATFAIALEFTRGAKQFGFAGGEGESFAFQKCIGTIFAITFDQFRFVIEEVQMRWGACQVQVDDVFGFAGEMPRSCSQRIHLAGETGRQAGECFLA